ncbi:antitoxin VapB family protein [Halostagnicola sp. A-GB9-2]|uniref:antitoxin VapB family protein n=1 Tax=Halostagnicola sp. A-GB9-2 TaxID=3048066 RepID=UPI0024C0A306|nr:antitoxin VapB family protein [Halostagnicola sp. A-GB9-2]MDJ1432064.1 antitoxin VapB family protein [Halostagnicola sp. A-GB9-2]
MESKTVCLKHETYRRLTREKRDDESFSDAIDRFLTTDDGNPLRELIGFVDEESHRAIEERRRLRERRATIGAVDVMIAGTAIEANKPVVTRNVGEFQRTSASVTPY